MTTSEGPGPKLFTHKPKKSQLKQSKAFESPPSSSSTMASQPSAPAPPPPQPPRESFARRYKFMWPLLLAVNFSVGAYLFMRTKKKDTGEADEVAVSVPSTTVTVAPSQTSPVTEDSTPSPPKVEPLSVREPIPEAQQRELFKWILEEKRKAKPKDPTEKKRIDEEKALLKQLIRAKAIPSI